MVRISSLRVVLLAVLSFALPAGAALLNPADPFGIHAREMGTSRANALFASNFSAALANPAALASLDDSAVALGYLYASRHLDMDGLAVGAPHNNVPLAGLRLNLSSMSGFGRDIGFGLAFGLDDNMGGLLTLTDAPASAGQFLREGRRQMLIAAGVGFQPIPYLRVGVSTLLAVNATANLSFQTSLSGQTANEAMAMDVGPRLSPVLGVLVGGWTLGPLKDLSAALSYRTSSWHGVRVEALADATLGGSSLTQLPLTMTFIDAFRPEEFSAGVQATVSWITASAGLEFSRWSRLTGLLASEDTVRKGAGLTFRDVVTPRLGVEAQLPQGFAARLGWAFEGSPLAEGAPSLLNAIDNARHVWSLGVGYTVPSSQVFRLPLSLDLAYQLHGLVARDVTLVASDGTTQAARAGGVIHALNLTATLRF